MHAELEIDIYVLRGQNSSLSHERKVSAQRLMELGNFSKRAIKTLYTRITFSISPTTAVSIIFSAIFIIVRLFESYTKYRSACYITIVLCTEQYLGRYLLLVIFMLNVEFLQF